MSGVSPEAKTTHEIAQAVNRMFAKEKPCLTEKLMANLTCAEKWVPLEVYQKLEADKNALEGRILDGYFSLPEPEKWKRDPYGFYPATVINAFVLGTIVCYKPEQVETAKFYFKTKIEKLEAKIAELEAKQK